MFIYAAFVSGNLFQLDFSDVNMKELEKNLTFVQKGGWYQPENCTCHHNKKVIEAVASPSQKYQQLSAIRSH